VTSGAAEDLAEGEGDYATPQAIDLLGFAAFPADVFWDRMYRLVVPRDNLGLDPMMSGHQWLVPALSVILLWTLYLPDGFFIGIRFTSSRVAES
jgi:hypothetical protein